jgi:excisionase family DNA binding protein
VVVTAVPRADPAALLVEAAAVRRLWVAARAYMQRTGAHDPALLEAIDALWQAAPAAPQAFLTMDEAAAVLRVSRSSLKRRIKDGAVAVERIGRRVLIPAWAITGHDGSGRVTALVGGSVNGDSGGRDPTQRG